MKFRGAGSSLNDFETGLRFKRVLEDPATDLVADDQIKKVIYCSGQVYYELESERNKRGIKDIAIVRLEQLAPFPFRSVEPSLQRYKNASVTWLQEEPKNQGAWSFVEPRFRTLLAKLNHQVSNEAEYAGRAISPSTATGYGKQHNAELQAFLN